LATQQTTLSNIYYRLTATHSGEVWWFDYSSKERFRLSPILQGLALITFKIILN